MLRLKNLTSLLETYASEKRQLWGQFPLDKVAAATLAVWETYQKGGTIYACGNGGNAAFAANLTNDLATLPFMAEDKHSVLPASLPRLRTVNLSDSPTSITALLNDLGPEHIFSEQLKMQRVQAPDLLFALSGSGNSPNILAAVAVARAVGARTIGISRGNGGKLASVADLAIIIPGISTFPGQTGGNNFNFHYEDALSSIAHMISGSIKQGVYEHVHIARA